MTEAEAPAVESRPPGAGEASPLAELEAAVQLAPADADAWAELGRAYHERGQEELSALALRKAVGLDPSSASHWYWLSIADRQAGEAASAVDAARRAVTLWPDSTLLLLNLGRHLVAEGRPAEARPWLEQALARSPGDAAVLRLLAVAVFRCEDFVSAAARLEETLRADPDEPVLWAYLGASLDETGRLEPAVWALESAVFASPDYGWAWGRLGKALRALGRHADAVAAFERSVEHGFAPPVLWSDLGHSAAELEDVDRVRRACRELGRLDASDLARALRARLRRLRSRPAAC